MPWSTASWAKSDQEITIEIESYEIVPLLKEYILIHSEVTNIEYVDEHMIMVS